MKNLITIMLLILPFLGMSQQFINSQNVYEKEIDRLLENNDCSVRAIAIAYEQTYFTSMNITYDIGREKKKGMSLRAFVTYLSRTPINNKRIVDMIKLTTPLSVKQISNISKYDNDNYLLVTKDHIFNYKNNIVYGNTNDNKIKDVIIILKVN